jgi:hypothetical protein
MGDNGWQTRFETFVCILDVQPGIRQFGYTVDDISAMVDGTIQRHRVTKISPRAVERGDLEDLFLMALEE